MHIKSSNKFNNLETSGANLKKVSISRESKTYIDNITIIISKNVICLLAVELGMFKSFNGKIIKSFEF